MPWSRRHRFAFTADGYETSGQGDMVVIYRGFIHATRALSDARRRFEEWQSLSDPLRRRRSAHQVVVLS